MKKIILISGKAGHGKDTFAEMLKTEFESQHQKVVITHFAKHIKRILQDYYGWDGVTKDDYWRHKLQYLGTEMIRGQLNKPFFHAQRACEDIAITANDFDYYIIPDCRFWNELSYTQAYFPRKVIDIRIIRSNFESPLTAEQQQHRSETDLDDYDFSDYVCNLDLDSLRHRAIRRVGAWLSYEKI